MAGPNTLDRMRATRSLLLLAGVMSVTVAGFAEKIEYPKTAKTEFSETLHGTPVPDPYRWLEDDNSPETKAWVEAQNKVTFAYLKSIPQREWIKERLTRVWNYERYGTPSVSGGRYFYSRNDGLQNQS